MQALDWTVQKSGSLSKIFWTRLFRIPRYLELIVHSLHLKLTPLFRTCQKQSTRGNSQATDKEWGPSSNRDSLTRYSLFAVERAEIRRQTSQLSFTIDKSIRKKPKTAEHSKSFQCNSVCWLIRHIITVFLFNQCLSSYCTVFYYQFYASPVISKPHYFELFAMYLGTSK